MKKYMILLILILLFTSLTTISGKERIINDEFKDLSSKEIIEMDKSNRNKYLNKINKMKKGEF